MNLKLSVGKASPLMAQWQKGVPAHALTEEVSAALTSLWTFSEMQRSAKKAKVSIHAGHKQKSDLASHWKSLSGSLDYLSKTIIKTFCKVGLRSLSMLSSAPLVWQPVRNDVHLSYAIYLRRRKIELNYIKEVAQHENNLGIQSQQWYCLCHEMQKYKLKTWNCISIAYEEKHWVKHKATVNEVCNFSYNWLPLILHSAWYQVIT